MTLTCCEIECQRLATFGILSEGDSADLTTHSCDKHLAELMDDGVSSVWPLHQLRHLEGEEIRGEAGRR